MWQCASISSKLIKAKLFPFISFIFPIVEIELIWVTAHAIPFIFSFFFFLLLLFFEASYCLANRKSFMGSVVPIGRTGRCCSENRIESSRWLLCQRAKFGSICVNNVASNLWKKCPGLLLLWWQQIRTTAIFFSFPFSAPRNTGILIKNFLSFADWFAYLTNVLDCACRDVIFSCHSQVTGESRNGNFSPTCINFIGMEL